MLLRTVHANVLGPALVAQAYLPLLERGAKKTVVNVSSGLASVGLDLGPKCATYSMSKAMLNMLVSPAHSSHARLLTLVGAQTYKQKAERPDITAVLIDPGWVKTGASRVVPVGCVRARGLTMTTRAVMGGEGAVLEVDFSVSHVLKLITSLTVEDSGKFFLYDGSTIPW